MGEQTTITVSRETLDRFNEVRKSGSCGDVPPPSADVFVNSLLDEWEYDDTADDVGRRYRQVIGSDEVAVVATNARGQEKLADVIQSSGGGDLAAEVRKLREQVDRVPQDTADELEGRFR